MKRIAIEDIEAFLDRAEKLEKENERLHKALERLREEMLTEGVNGRPNQIDAALVELKGEG